MVGIMTKELVNRVSDMKKLYDESILAAENKGEVKGKVKGKIEDILEELGEKGSLTEDQISMITKEADLETLKRWFKVARKAESIEEFFKLI